MHDRPELSHRPRVPRDHRRHPSAEVAGRRRDAASLIRRAEDRRGFVQREGARLADPQLAPATAPLAERETEAGGGVGVAIEEGGPGPGTRAVVVAKALA